MRHLLGGIEEQGKDWEVLAPKGLLLLQHTCFPMTGPIHFAHTGGDGAQDLRPPRAAPSHRVAALYRSKHRKTAPMKCLSPSPGGGKEERALQQIFENGIDLSNGIVITERRLSGGGEMEDSQG